KVRQRVHQTDSTSSLPGLTRQSIIYAKTFLRRRWMRGSSPRMTGWTGAQKSSQQSRIPVVCLGHVPIARAPALLQRREHAVGRDRQFVEAHPDGVGDGIGQRRQERRERTLARLLGPERAVRIVPFADADLDRR